MAARWIGLKRPHTLKFAAARARARRGLNHAIHECLHALGATGMLLIAAAMNFALYPDAIASVFTGHAAIPMEIAQQVDAQPSAAIAFDEDDVRLLAATAWGEARSEGEEGMRAVAHVMVNRVGERFGSDLKSVILAPKQFSAWNAGDPNRPLVQHPERYATGGVNLVTWQVAQQVAREVLSGQSVDPTNGALFYHTRAVHPWWDRYTRGATVIGAHIFFRDVADHPGLVTRYDPNAVTRVAATRGGRRAAAAGPRAGRVHGVIQHASGDEAPAASTLAATPVSASAPSPEAAAAIAQLPTSASY